MSVHRAEPAARRGRRTSSISLKLPNLAVQMPRDSQIGVVAELSLDVRALITHPTQGFVSFCSIGSIDICCMILYLNSCNILLEVGDGIVRLHPILGDLGCIPAHIKYIQLLHCTDTLCLLRNQSYVCYIRYIVTQFQWDPIGYVSELNTFAKGVKNVNTGTCTWNSISTNQYKIYLTPGAPQG